MKVLKKLRVKAEDRRGGIILLAAFSIMILLTFCLFSIDVAYVQLVRTELRTATDAASNAGCEALSREQDQQAAVDAAIAIAALNTVGGRPLVLEGADVDLGSSEVDPNTGLFEFTTIVNGGHLPTSSQTPIPEMEKGAVERAEFGISFQLAPQQMNSVRVTADRGDITAISGGLFQSGTFKPTQQATSTNSIRDVALVLDRSGSMQQDEDGYYYKTVWWNGKLYYQYPYQLVDEVDWKMTQLKTSVDSFLTILENAPTELRCSLSSYSTNATRDVEMTADLDSIRSKVNILSPSGTTNIGGGLQLGTDSLQDDDDARPYATKAVVLMTDGMHNTGTHPEGPDSPVQDCIDRGHVVYTITFGKKIGADMIAAHDLMQRIADDTGGKHYPVSSGAELEQAFKDIANAVAVMLVQ